MKIPSFNLDAIAGNIAPYIHNTPIHTSSLLDQELGCSVFFKCENFQKGGSFKLRGAMNAVLNRVVGNSFTVMGTHSSGNFTQALALAARFVGKQAHIVMPENAPQVKMDAVQSYGATIHECASTIEAREEALAGLVTKMGMEAFHPYDCWDVIGGQATVGRELLEAVDDLDVIFCPLGGGGLVSGTLLAAQAKGVRVIGVEPEMANDAYRGWKQKDRITSHRPQTMADGLRTTVGIRNFEIISDQIHDIVCVSEQEIAESLEWIFSRMKLVVEPSSATVLAAIRKTGSLWQGKKVGAILSGGNIVLPPFTP